MHRFAAILVVLILAAGNAAVLASARSSSMSSGCPHHSGCTHHSVFTCCAMSGPGQADPMAAVRPAPASGPILVPAAGDDVVARPAAATSSVIPFAHPRGYPPGDLLTRLTTLLI